jgi:DNA polymerase-3 subunit beta
MTATVVETSPTLKATCQRKDLYDGVQTVAHAVSGRSTLPIYSHLVIQSGEGTLQLIGGDGELAITTTIAGSIDQPGAMTANAKMLTELISALPDSSVAISVDPSFACHLKCARSDYRLLGLPADEYPQLPDLQEQNSFRIHQGLLRNMIRKVAFAVSSEEVRPILTGVLMVFEEDKLTLAATDTHRLAVRSAKVEGGTGAGQAIVPARAMSELVRLLTDEDGEVEVRLSSNQVLFVTPSGVNLYSQLIQGQFPNYQRVVPVGGDRRLTLETGPFRQAVKRASIVARNAAHRILLKTSGETVLITAESRLEGAAYEEVEVAREGEDITIAFNARYMLDVLNAVDEDGFTLELTESLKPGLLRPISDDTEGDYFCVLMPMQII